ncbi:hypothetical protein [Spirosoma fluminis]
MFIVFVKSGVSVALALVLILVLNRRSWIKTQFDSSVQVPWLLVFWTVFRLLPFVGVYLILGYMPQSDASEYYYPISLTALDGGIPYRDVYSGYSPLFGYWIAPFLAVWRDSRMVVLVMLLVEGLAVLLTYRYYKNQDSTGDRLFRALFYYLLPLPFTMSVFSGQEDVVLWLFALLAIPFMDRQPLLAGVVLGLGMMATKIVFALVLMPVCLLMLGNLRTAIRFGVGLAIVILPVMGWMYWKTGLLFLQQQSSEGDIIKAPNWRSVLNPVLTDGLRSVGAIWKWGGLAITLLVILAGTGFVRSRAPRWRYRDYVPFIFVLVYSVMTVVQQNAISHYAYLFMLPLVFTLVDFRRNRWCIGLIGFNVLAAIHPSLWWRLGMPVYDRLSALLKPIALLEYSIEVLLVIGFFYYAVQAMNALRRPRSVTQAEPYAV